jgi:membrane protein required for colicin V production
LNTIDLVVLAVLGFNAALGAFRGFLRQSLGLSGVILGVGAACAYYDAAAENLRAWFGLEDWSAFALKAAGFLSVGLVVYAVGQIAAAFARNAAEKARMGGADRALGFAFGAAKGGVICAIVFASADLFVPSLPDSLQEEFLGGPDGNPQGSRAYRLFIEHVKSDADEMRKRLVESARKKEGR